MSSVEIATRAAALGLQLTALADRAGKPASRCLLEFLTVNIRNKNTRKAYSALPLRFCGGAKCRALTGCIAGKCAILKQNRLLDLKP
jgi:hypothetical protein